MRRFFKRTGLKNICIAGGVAQNSVANGKILEKTTFENLYIPPAGHDAGSSWNPCPCAAKQLRQRFFLGLAE